MESPLLNPGDPILILDFLQTFERACNNLFIYEGTTFFSFAHSQQGSAKQDLLHRVGGGSDDDRNDEEPPDGALCFYDEAVNYLLQKYVDCATISAKDAAII